MASISSCFTVTPRSHSSLVFSPKSSTLFKSTSQFHSFRPIASLLLKNNPLLPPPSSKGRYGNRVSLLVPSFVVSARIDVNPTAIRPGGAVESDKLPVDVRRRAMDAVDVCGGRVTIGDVASKAGLKLNEAQKALQALAADTDGFLEVSDEGDVLYVFPKDYRSKLAAKSFRMKIEPFVEKAKSGAEYVIRVSFGTALIASIVIVYTAIIALLSSRSDEDDRGRRGGRSYDSGFTFFFRPSDLFCGISLGC